MKRKNIFAGCSNRLNISQCYENQIYYCSSSNIIVSDSIEIKDVIFLDNNLNFIQIVNGEILSGDSTGRFYIIKDGIVEKFDTQESIQNGYVLKNNKILYLTLNKAVLFDTVEKNIVASYCTKEILSSLCFINDLFYIGTCEGNTFVFDIDLNLLKVVSTHYDRIQGSSTVLLNGEAYLATSSKDCTIKIWRCTGNDVEHVQTLNGHSDWVSSVYWTEDGNLISSSFDKSIIFWTRDSHSTWLNTKIYGGSKPFQNALMLNGTIYGQSTSGGFYKFEDSCDFISGHTNEITSVDWKDSFVLTSSLDKTSRIFLDNREVSRPQNHGCPVTSSKFLNENDLTIISGAQETIIRVLEPTYITYMAITNDPRLNEYLTKENNLYINNNLCTNKNAEPRNFAGLEEYKLAAVPAELSLTNDVLEDFDFEGLSEYILSTTAFNETKKLYGHYFDVVDIDVCKKHIASVNRALSKKFSGVFLWNRQFEVLQYLEVHNSTINRVRFSPDGKYLATASKDKTSALFEIQNTKEEIIVKYLNKDHSRIVWDCSFSHDSKFYATCSRDKKIIIYNVEDNRKLFEGVFDKEVTAVDFDPRSYDLVLGLESGEVDRIVFSGGLFRVDEGFRFKSNSKKINCLRFNSDGRYLAIGGSDWLLSIYETN
ncbi:Elongator complex protein 2 [Nosema granulosis]|uniref:Elongator complex protein 2 n=1 Tax=Nosema granulosis TaxID=83296 RepID=A0A9P6KYQ1_9MICR|nr:Elongator complex protein 2 [Nosema granulosis]